MNAWLTNLSQLLITGLMAAFGAVVGPAGVAHAGPVEALLIGDSVIMVKDAQDDKFNALLCTYWPDVDGAWDRAVPAGAQVIYPLADQLYGERGGRLSDPFGNQWMLAARIETVTSAMLAAREPA